MFTTSIKLYFVLTACLNAGIIFAQTDTILYKQDTLQTGCTARYLKSSVFIIPGAFLVYSGLKPFVNGIQKADDSLYEHMRERYAGFHTNAENYLMWVPSASVYTLDAFHIKTQHNFKEHLMLDASSVVITGGIGYAMRLISKHISAYNTYHTRFPSGHTANAFRSAEFFHQELKKINPLLSYSGYLVAATVGVLRIYNKDHLLTEVFAGAGLGILSTKFTYWLFDKIKCKNHKITN